MVIDFLLTVFDRYKDKDAIIWKDKPFTYLWLLERIYYWQEVLKTENISPGTVVMLEADFSPDSIALFLVLIGHGCILVPLTSSVALKKQEFTEISQGELSITIDDNDNAEISKLSINADHEFYQKLRQQNHPGLVLFSSGSTGKSKAAVHDFMGLLEKFKVRRHSFRAITFLLYDHIGGVNTMLYTLANAGCIVTVQDRSPDSVLQAIDKYKVELLPTSPTFINLILLSEAYKKHNMETLSTVTYGTEPMPQSTLERFHQLFPHVRLLQTYGLSEVGILSSKSKTNDSLWVKVGGEGYQTRIVDGILQIKAKAAMLGYLNAPNPFTEDGWFNTGDSVEVDGEYIKILGRKSEIINVGGEKVYPAEVESVIQEIDNVEEVTVYGEKNPIVGNIVCAKVKIVSEEDHKKLALRVKKYCQQKLQNYKVPVKVTIAEEKQHSGRYKKMRCTDV